MLNTKCMEKLRVFNSNIVIHIIATGLYRFETPLKIGSCIHSYIYGCRGSPFGNAWSDDDFIKAETGRLPECVNTTSCLGRIFVCTIPLQSIRKITDFTRPISFVWSQLSNRFVSVTFVLFCAGECVLSVCCCYWSSRSQQRFGGNQCFHLHGCRVKSVSHVYIIAVCMRNERMVAVYVIALL
jgi:hypothetical protein